MILQVFRIIGLAVLVAIFTGWMAPVSAEPAVDKNHYTHESNYPSASQCANCHQQIYNEWASSSHAYASISPMFHKFEQKISDLTRGTIGSFCVRCHQQVGTQMGEARETPLWERSAISREGITCITCHRIQEEFGNLKGINLAYIGDGNNVANSLMICGAMLGVNVRICSPKGFEADSNILKKAKSLSEFGSTISICNEPSVAVKEANVLYTDVWASMGQEEEYLKRKEIFEKFRVDRKLIGLAAEEVILLHCLPAHRGEEITEEALESKNSYVFDQAENRLHVQQALLAVQLGGL